MPSNWKLTKKAKRIMSLLNSVFGSSGQANNNIAANSVPVTSGVIGQSQLALTGTHWNAAQGTQNSYPYTNVSNRALHVIVKQVENGYILEVGGSVHIASDLKEITDLLTNRVAATLLEWNP